MKLNKISSLLVQLFYLDLFLKNIIQIIPTGLERNKKIIDEFFDEDGFPKNRNLENLIVFLQYFVLIKEWIKSAQENVPEYLEEIIRKI